MEASDYIPRYTIEEYLAWPGEWELWRGIPVAMSPSPSYEHQALASRILVHLANQLEAAESCRCEALAELDWHVAHDTVYRPDISVVCEVPEGPFLHRPPELIVEVLSPSTAAKDRVEKRKVYAANGVKFYVIADPKWTEASAMSRFEVLGLEGGRYIALDDQVANRLELHEGCSVVFDPAAVA